MIKYTSESDTSQVQRQHDTYSNKLHLVQLCEVVAIRLHVFATAHSCSIGVKMLPCNYDGVASRCPTSS